MSNTEFNEHSSHYSQIAHSHVQEKRVCFACVSLVSVYRVLLLSYFFFPPPFPPLGPIPVVERKDQSVQSWLNLLYTCIGKWHTFYCEYIRDYQPWTRPQTTHVLRRWGGGRTHWCPVSCADKIRSMDSRLVQEIDSRLIACGSSPLSLQFALKEWLPSSWSWWFNTPVYSVCTLNWTGIKRLLCSW